LELRASLKGFFKPSLRKIFLFLLAFFFAPFPFYNCNFIDEPAYAFCGFALFPMIAPLMFTITIDQTAQIYEMIQLSLYTVVSYVSGCFSAWFIARRGKKDFIAIGLTVVWLNFYNSFLGGLCIDGTTGGICFDPWDIFYQSLVPVILFGSIYTAFRIWKYKKSSKIKTA